MADQFPISKKGDRVLPFDSTDFRKALGKFATGVTVVTVVSDRGGLTGVTVNAFSSVSLTPPLVLFCLASASASLSLFTGADRFAVNTLSETQPQAARYFGGIAEGRATDFATKRGETGCLFLAESLVSLECRPFAVHPGGDHEIIVAEVLNIVEGTGDRPLLFCKDEFAHLP